MLLAALATWRLSNLLVNEDGPFEVFDWLRAQFDVRWETEVQRHYLLPGSNNEVGRMLLCIYCTSIWVAIFFVALTLLLPQVAFVVTAILALSAVSCLLDHYMEA